MKKYLTIILLLSAIMLPAEPQKISVQQQREQKLMQTMSAYPDILVSFNDRNLNKQTVIKLMLKYHPDFEDYTSEELTDAIRRVTDEEIYYILCIDFLKKNGFAPSQQMAFQFLRDAMQQFPAELKKLKYKNKTLQTLASDRDTQLNIAIRRYLKEKKADEIKVNTDEIEYFYRVNQNIFMHDAKINISFIATAKSDPAAFKTLKNASYMLKQGVRFDKLAQKINSKLPKDFFKMQGFPPEMAARAAKMQLNTPSHIIEFPNYYAIIMVSQKNQPSYIPLAKAEFFIKTELESRKSRIFMENLLNQLLKNTEIKRFAF